MEIVSLLLIVFFAYIFLKLFGAFFHAGIWLLALPFKILAVALSIVVTLVVLVPLGFAGALLSLIAIPAALFVLLLPLLLIVGGLWLLFRQSD